MTFKDGEFVKFSFEFNNKANNTKELVSGSGIVVGFIPQPVAQNTYSHMYLIESDNKTRLKFKNDYGYDYRVFSIAEEFLTRKQEIEETSKDIQTR